MSSSSWDFESLFEGADEVLENSVRYLVKHPLISLAILIAIHLGLWLLLRSQPPSMYKFNDLKISEIYIYPIKSLRGTKVTKAVASKYGFDYDRRFMLLQVTKDGYKNMQVSKVSEMVRFLTNINLPEEGKSNGTIDVTFTPPGSDKSDSIKIPLTPTTDKLDTLEVEMYTSATKAYKMPAEYNAWFSKCFGYDVVLAYVGDNRRDVLFQDLMPKSNSWWPSRKDYYKIGFADCAPFLIVSKTSLDDVSKRLSEGQKADITKFRPNIVLEGAESPWEEDFWARLNIGGNEVFAEHNCGRCNSVNVDFNTGKTAEGEHGQILKKMQSDRRIDLGAKYSPVFGRYCFWNEKNGIKTLSVGDDVKITRFNPKPTTFSWNLHATARPKV